MKAIVVLSLLFCLSLPAAAEYEFQPLGTFGRLISLPTDINSLGQVSGLLTGA